MLKVRQRIARVLVAGLASLGGLVLVVGETPLIDSAGAPLQRFAPLQKSDAIVIFSGGANEEGIPTDASLRRLIYGLRLWREDYAPILILSGGSIFTDEAESDSMARVVKELGFPTTPLIIERRARRTFEQAQEITKIVQARNMRQVLLVTSRTHSYRAVRAFEKTGIPVIPETTDPLPESVRAKLHHPFFASNPAACFARVCAAGEIGYEYAAIAFYWWKG